MGKVLDEDDLHFTLGRMLTSRGLSFLVYKMMMVMTLALFGCDIRVPSGQIKHVLKLPVMVGHHHHHHYQQQKKWKENLGERIYYLVFKEHKVANQAKKKKSELFLTFLHLFCGAGFSFFFLIKITDFVVGVPGFESCFHHLLVVKPPGT